MADQKNRGGQKKGKLQPRQSEKKQGVNVQGKGRRSDRKKQADQQKNPDDSRRRRPTSSADGLPDGKHRRLIWEANCPAWGV